MKSVLLGIQCACIVKIKALTHHIALYVINNYLNAVYAVNFPLFENNKFPSHNSNKQFLLLLIVVVSATHYCAFTRRRLWKKNSSINTKWQFISDLATFHSFRKFRRTPFLCRQNSFHFPWSAFPVHQQ